MKSHYIWVWVSEILPIFLRYTVLFSFSSHKYVHTFTPFHFCLLFTTFMDHMGFLILILKCNQDTEMIKQHIIDSNIEEARNKEREQNKERKGKRGRKKNKFSLWYDHISFVLFLITAHWIKFHSMFICTLLDYEPLGHFKNTSITINCFLKCLFSLCKHLSLGKLKSIGTHLITFHNWFIVWKTMKMLVVQYGSHKTMWTEALGPC